ncbi:hypothetical protein PanWU01x14_107410 [Parasponia andersonii]|uniref:Uncharacterized protein n=1 Tax=Parasponia andersonii TaxID=3476 RepID=A0A2P5D085_PARAD|nr:hypothetical protein PanWU01x14_107410 [Parasponia andersonii]
MMSPMIMPSMGFNMFDAIAMSSRSGDKGQTTQGPTRYCITLGTPSTSAKQSVDEPLEFDSDEH